MKKKFYITTTLPYVNAEPHIGFALEIVQTDVLARYYRLKGYDVVFNTGTDEHGLKIYKKALEEKKDPQAYCDEYASRFEKLKSALNLSYTNFTRTTNPDHKKAAQEFWIICQKNGFIDKKLYKIKYCVGCELEKTDSELVDGHCPLHPKEKILISEEENYFFKFSAFQTRLLELYDKSPQFVLPDFRQKEIKNFVETGLEDFSISRLKKKLPWGVDVPGDPEHVMYVWFDALVNYISTIGWPNDIEKFEDFWPGVQVAGKDNLRQQSAMWQAMLMAAGLPTSKQIVIHGFINSGGKKMSKSIGNVINPFDLVNEYNTDAVRYYLLREIPTLDDGDFSESRMKEVYDADLANELGNLVSRITTLASSDDLSFELTDSDNYDQGLGELIKTFQLNQALEKIWTDIKALNKTLDVEAPWKKSASERATFLKESLNKLFAISSALSPFLPQTSEKIQEAISGPIKKSAPLFPKK